MVARLPTASAQAARGLAPWLLTLAALGCGNDLAQVTGVVTVDGQPLRGGDNVRATVVYQPASGNGVTAIGNVGADGSYHLMSGSQPGATPGEYLVACTATQKIVGKDPNAAPTGKRITDPKYANPQTSGLQFIVQPGNNELNIALASPGHGT
ncbi:MAG: hypothetical protein IT424_01610 [Pirellulales bacterium]|nr:hypothetical protein [Pirellulales bacterium]